MVRLRPARYRGEDDVHHAVRGLSVLGTGLAPLRPVPHSWLYDPWDPFWADNPIPRTRYEAYAEIVMLTPAQAKDDPHALNAADVIAHLGPAAAPPPPAAALH